MHIANDFITFRRGYHICYRGPRGVRSSADDGIGAAGATGGTGITNMDVDGGFVNKAAMFDDDDNDDGDMRYTKLQARSVGDGADGPPDTPRAPPPEYTRHPSYPEVFDDPV